MINARVYMNHIKTVGTVFIVGAIMFFFIGCKSFYQEKMENCMGKDKSYVEGEFGEFTKCKPTQEGEVCIIYTHPRFNEVWAYFDWGGHCYRITTR